MRRLGGPGHPHRHLRGPSQRQSQSQQRVVFMGVGRVTHRPVEGAGVVLAAAVSAVGLVVHNFADLPGQTVLSPESLYPMLLTAALVAIWFTPSRRAATWALLGWSALNLVGGGITACCPGPPSRSIPSNRPGTTSSTCTTSSRRSRS